MRKKKNGKKDNVAIESWRRGKIRIKKKEKMWELRKWIYLEKRKY